MVSWEKCGLLHIVSEKKYSEYNVHKCELTGVHYDHHADKIKVAEKGDI